MALGKPIIGTSAVLVLLVGSCTGLWLYAQQLGCEYPAYVGEQVEIVTAHRDIPRGARLTKADIDSAMIPRKYLPPNPLLVTELNSWLGIPLSVGVEKGDLILTSDFSGVASP